MRVSLSIYKIFKLINYDPPMLSNKTSTPEIFRQRILALATFIFAALLFIALYWFFIGQFEESDEKSYQKYNLMDISLQTNRANA
jgi:hypothetical protein